ncbi:MgtC/SapB family protein [Streptomyces erythrochromogenes]|uniref:MgtC/SapB family protein n=2 Tax=Streptomyces erythrochromogenes TaxID=285574 RepID=UPI0038244434
MADRRTARVLHAHPAREDLVHPPLRHLAVGEGRVPRTESGGVSGIGFLGAGVIMRGGLSVRGPNTAATLWRSAAVGCLAGVGLFVLAVCGTADVVGANLLLRPPGRRLGREPRGGAEGPRGRGGDGPTGRRAAEYRFEAMCLEAEEAHIRHRLVDALGRPGYQLRSIRSQDGPAPGRVTVSALLTAEGTQGRALEEAVSNLALDPSVSAVSRSVVPS